MEIKSSKLVITTAPVDSVGGAKPEPEERPLAQVFETTGFKTGMNDGNVTRGGGRLPTSPGRQRDNMAGSVVVHQTVQQHVDTASRCETCVHFDRAEWHRILAKWLESPRAEDRSSLDQVRAAALAAEGGNVATRTGQDINTVLRSMGVCRAYSRFFEASGYSKSEALSISHPYSVCWSEMGHAGPQLPRFYKPRLGERWRRWRDELLMKADGKRD